MQAYQPDFYFPAWQNRDASRQIRDRDLRCNDEIVRRFVTVRSANMIQVGRETAILAGERVLSQFDYCRPPSCHERSDVAVERIFNHRVALDQFANTPVQ